MFDIKGNRRKWWSNGTLANFERKSVCLVDQYSNFTFYGRKVNYYFCHLKQFMNWYKGYKWHIHLTVP